jgi:hypothetical protein
MTGFGQNLDKAVIASAAKGFTCKLCGNPIVILEEEVWDDPGDCCPTVDYCYYIVHCEHCQINSAGQPLSPTAAISKCSFVEYKQ